MESKISNAGMLSRDSDGLRYHVFRDRAAAIATDCGKASPHPDIRIE